MPKISNSPTIKLLFLVHFATGLFQLSQLSSGLNDSNLLQKGSVVVSLNFSQVGGKLLTLD